MIEENDDRDKIISDILLAGEIICLVLAILTFCYGMWYLPWR